MSVDPRLTVYQGGNTRVAVYNTYADDRRLHFDVFLPMDAQDRSTMDAAALEAARTFLSLLGRPEGELRINLCERCHIDDTGVYRGQLWQLPESGALIWPLEGCPKPSA